MRRRLIVAVLLLVVVLYSVHCIPAISAPGEFHVDGRLDEQNTVSLAFESSVVRYVFVIEGFVSQFYLISSFRNI